MRDDKEASWPRGGFFKTPVYRAVLSSQVGTASKFRKSKKEKQEGNNRSRLRSLVVRKALESQPSCELQTLGTMLFAFLHLDELLLDPACRADQLVEPPELNRVLRLLII